MGTTLSANALSLAAMRATLEQVMTTWRPDGELAQLPNQRKPQKMPGRG